MVGEPTLRDLLEEHWQLALRLRKLRIDFDAGRCVGAAACYDVCPVDCWEIDEVRQVARFLSQERCIACGACVLQCPEEAIRLVVPARERAG
jgi:NAD-dependent dihydropyrimidine dehydrogenase PreA subunit